jgi:hypothetical protein
MRTIVIVAIVLSLIGAARADSAADTTRRPIQIPSQDLRLALRRYAEIEHLHMIFLAEDVKNKSSEEVSGTLTDTEALNQLLRGSHLTYMPIDTDTMMILPVRAASESSESEVDAVEEGGTSRPAQVTITAPDVSNAGKLKSLRALGDVSRQEYERLAETLPFEKSVNVKFSGTLRYRGPSHLGTHVQSATIDGLVVSRVFKFTQEKAESKLLVYNTNAFPLFVEVDYGQSRLGEGAYFALAPGETGLAISWIPRPCGTDTRYHRLSVCSDYPINPGTARVRMLGKWDFN